MTLSSNLALPREPYKIEKKPQKYEESWYMENSEKAERRSVEKAALEPLLRKADKSKGGQNQVKRPKAREKMQLQQRKERLEMLVVSNKEQLCFVEAAFLFFLFPCSPSRSLAFFL